MDIRKPAQSIVTVRKHVIVISTRPNSKTQKWKRRMAKQTAVAQNELENFSKKTK